MKDFRKKYFLQVSLLWMILLLGCTVNRVSAGNAFICVPQSDSALYTDANNWVNGNYPGTNIAEGDSIVFKPGDEFSLVIINASITMLGHCRVDSGVILNVNNGFDLGGMDLFPTFSTDLKTEAGSKFILNGALTSYARNGIFNGDVMINGSFRARTFDGYDRSGSCEFYFNAELIVTGSLHFNSSHINCQRVSVDSTGSITGSISYEFWISSLHIDSLYNSGSVYLREVFFTCGVLQNDSSFITYTISAGSVLNTGEFTISDYTPEGWSNKESTISQLVNQGNFEIFNIKLFLSTPFLNAQNFVIHEGSLIVTEIVNEGSFVVKDNPIIQWDSFVNNGSFAWTAIDANTENELQSNFVNNGSFTNFGKLRIIGGSFTNNGTVNIIPL